MPFVKLDCKILDKSIWRENSDTCKVWITLLAMADSEGFVEAAIPGIADRSRISLEATEFALDKFQQPDKYSSNLENDGKRIFRVNGGFRILNYNSYREKDYASKIRVRNFRERQQTGEYIGIKTQNGRCDCCDKKFEIPYNLYVVQDHDHKTNINRGVVCKSCNVLIGKVESGKYCNKIQIGMIHQYLKKWGVVTDCNVTERNPYASVSVSKSVSESFNIFWKEYPKKIGKHTSEKSFKKLNPDKELFDRIMFQLKEQKRYWTDIKYIPHPATWINGKRWEDDLSSLEKPTKDKIRPNVTDHRTKAQEIADLEYGIKCLEELKLDTSVHPNNYKQLPMLKERLELLTKSGNNTITMVDENDNAI